MSTLTQEKVLEYRQLYYDNQNGKTQTQLAKEHKVTANEISRRIRMYKKWLKENGY